MAIETVKLKHSKVELALHRLSDARDESTRPLLFLHGLGERSPDALPPEFANWKGEVWALDFTGHGESTVPRGGGYTAELMIADADTALRYLDEATFVGKGLGGYIALLAAGARPEKVLGAVILDGPGLIGGGGQPNSYYIAMPDVSAVGPPDPFALVELARDIRPPDYSSAFVWLATSVSPLEYPIAVCGKLRPQWIEAIVGEPGVIETDLESALEMYAAT
jgi:pimeloyl-ACP methyl ester carboxylesterase